MVLYFTGTGNSRHVARMIAEGIGDELVSINKLMKEGFAGTLKSEKPFVVVAPTYTWRMPLVVEKFLKGISYEGNDQMYVTVTCDTQVGAGKHYAKKLVESLNLKYMGFAHFYMPENYIVMFPEYKLDEATAKIKKADKKVKDVILLLKENKPLDRRESNYFVTAATAVANPLFYRFYARPKGFYATDACIGCGKCEKVCSLNNIKMAGKKPSWGDECTHCMACISKCPKAAIEYKRKTKGKRRYYLDEQSHII